MFVESDAESRWSTMHTKHGCSHGSSVPDCIYNSVIKLLLLLTIRLAQIAPPQLWPQPKIKGGFECT